MDAERLNKRLVKLGLATSRRKADELIASGQVSVDGQVCTNLATLVKSSEQVTVKGRSGAAKPDIYLAYYKPRGVVCSHRGQGSRTVFDDLPKNFSSLKIGGRLDKDSEGLMVLTSDGKFIQELTHPSKSKSKTYIVKTKQALTAAEIEHINKGVKLKDGVSKLKTTALNDTTLKIIMSEGRNRQIRRTLEFIGKDVVELQRVSIGNYANPRLQKGQYVFIKPEAVL